MASKPLFNAPAGASAKVRIIDSTLNISGIPLQLFLGPPVDGLDKLDDLPCWSFLIESQSGQKVLFDLGVPKDLTAFSPKIQNDIKSRGWHIHTDKNVADILRENEIAPSDISSVIWSHSHFDHIGDISTFPNSTELVVGPGFKDKFAKAYPTDPESPLRESYWKDRRLREISFDQVEGTTLQIGPFQAFDFFGDGSFYLLNAPGHCLGHVAGLARTTQNPDTFIFMGGDLVHHGAEIRPSPYVPLPDSLQFPLPDVLRSRMSSCPGGELFRKLNVQRGRKADEPFFDPTMGEDIPLAIETIRKAQTADAQSNVFFIFAHDPLIRGVVDLFPAAANDWYSKGWSEETRWAFLKDLSPAAVELK